MDRTIDNQAMGEKTDPAVEALHRKQLGRWIGRGVVAGAILSVPMLAIAKIMCDRIRPLAAYSDRSHLPPFAEDPGPTAQSYRQVRSCHHWSSYGVVAQRRVIRKASVALPK